jgi:hypothetical protein
MYYTRPLNADWYDKQRHADSVRNVRCQVLRQRITFTYHALYISFSKFPVNITFVTQTYYLYKRALPASLYCSYC